MIRFATLAALLLVGACQAPLPPLYAWDGYAKVIHDSRWSPGEVPVQEQIATMEQDRNSARIRDLQLPPGWRVHLGMLYEIAGDTAKARDLLLEEKRVFPESATFVDVLVGGLEPRTESK